MLRVNKLLGIILLFATTCANASNEQPDSVVQAVRESVSKDFRLSVCLALRQTNIKPNTPADEKKRADAIRLVAQKMKMLDANILRARADVARKGLYGFKQDQELALSLYERSKSADAGFNAALMLYRRGDATNNTIIAKRILNDLYHSGAAKDQARGIVGAQSHYLAGIIQEAGLAGPADLRKAFLHFRTSARNNYVPGVFHYLRLLIQSLPKLKDGERQFALQEIRLMTNRWRWQSPDIMMLSGDLYAEKWFSDDADGFFAQYYWRIAQKMEGHREIVDFDRVIQGRYKRLSKEKEIRLDEAVQSAMRNVVVAKHDMEFIDLCVE